MLVPDLDPYVPFGSVLLTLAPGAEMPGTTYWSGHDGGVTGHALSVSICSPEENEAISSFAFYAPTEIES
jgi:hypothetical protein